jgi:hypothetical protein
MKAKKEEVTYTLKIRIFCLKYGLSKEVQKEILQLCKESYIDCFKIFKGTHDK